MIIRQRDLGIRGLKHAVKGDVAGRGHTDVIDVLTQREGKQQQEEV